MSSEEVQLNQESLISSKIKDELQEMNFILSTTLESGVMWGFDGSTKHFPRDTYVKEEKDGKPKIKLKVEKTNNGFTLIINSIPFKIQNHIDRYQLEIEEIIPIVKEYMSLI